VLRTLPEQLTTLQDALLPLSSLYPLNSDQADLLLLQLLVPEQGELLLYAQALLLYITQLLGLGERSLGRRLRGGSFSACCTLQPLNVLQLFLDVHRLRLR